MHPEPTGLSILKRMTLQLCVRFPQVREVKTFLQTVAPHLRFAFEVVISILITSIVRMMVIIIAAVIASTIRTLSISWILSTCY